jgi:hypothetical protein
VRLLGGCEGEKYLSGLIIQYCRLREAHTRGTMAAGREFGEVPTSEDDYVSGTYVLGIVSRTRVGSPPAARLDKF